MSEEQLWQYLETVEGKDKLLEIINNIEEIERLNKDLETSIDICNKRQVEIVRLNNIINTMDKEIDNLCKNQKKEIERLNNIINELEKWAEGYIFADIFKDKIKELKENKK